MLHIGNHRSIPTVWELKSFFFVLKTVVLKHVSWILSGVPGKRSINFWRSRILRYTVNLKSQRMSLFAPSILQGVPLSSTQTSSVQHSPQFKTKNPSVQHTDGMCWTEGGLELRGVEVGEPSTRDSFEND